MEVEQIGNHLKYINANGVTLNIDERLNLELALKTLQNDFNFEELLFWGKVNGKFNVFYVLSFDTGFVKDYYIAVALKYVGISDFPRKSFFWCNSSNWTFASLPQPLSHLSHLKKLFDKIDVYFYGEFDKVIEFAEIEDKSLEIPKKGVSELDRLSYVVNAIENDC